MTLRQILKRLNFGPWFPRCGRHPWSPSTVHHILSDPVYTGTAYANRYEFVAAKKPRPRKPTYSGVGCRRLRPKDQWIPIAVPALIDQDLWDRAQAQLARNATLSFRNNSKHDYLLRCLLTCGACGLSMHGTTRPAGKRAERLYYRCAGKDCVETARAQPCPRAGHRAGGVGACPRSAGRPGAAGGPVPSVRRRCRAYRRPRAAGRTADRGTPRRVGARRPAFARCLPSRRHQSGRTDRTARTDRRATTCARPPVGAAARPTRQARQGAGGRHRPDGVLRAHSGPVGGRLFRRQAGDLAPHHRTHHRS